jgi:hypothetical protein
MNKIKFLIETPNFQNKKIKIYNFIKLTDLKNLWLTYKKIGAEKGSIFTWKMKLYILFQVYLV